MSQKIKFDQISTAGFEDSGEYVLSLDSTGAFTWGFNPPPEPWYFVGTTSAYSIGGMTCGTPGASTESIAKFSLTSDGNSTAVGSVTGYFGRICHTGHKSDVCGYVTGGRRTGGPTAAVVEFNKWPFAADTPTANGGNLTAAVCKAAGSSSETHGYTSGSIGINKFPFASDTCNATCIGALAANTGNNQACHSSSYDGYVSGNGGIDKFSFSSDGSATCIGSLSACSLCMNLGISSITEGYNVSGLCTPTVGTTFIQSFPFATDTNSTCVGDITNARVNGSTASTCEYGYHWGGRATYEIEKFPFASVSTCVNVGCITTTHMLCFGTGTHT